MQLAQRGRQPSLMTLHMSGACRCWVVVVSGPPAMEQRNDTKNRVFAGAGADTQDTVRANPSLQSERAPCLYRQKALMPLA